MPGSNTFAQIYSNSILVIVIALLTCLTLNRGIYLYFDKKYKNIEERLKDHRTKSGTEVTNENVEEKNKEYDLIKEDEKKLNILYYRIQLGASVVILLVAICLKKMQLKMGFMIGAFINIFYNSVRNWRHINEGEKFSITAISLGAVITFVIKYCK
jgi:hypothetical protein